MKKFIWISFAVLAALWTALVAITTEIVSWSFSLISSSQVGDVANGGLNLQVPLWLTPWVDQSTVNSFELSATYIAQWLNSILPNSIYVGDFLNVIIWLTWALVLFVMLIVAAVAHWFAANSIKSNPQNPSVHRNPI